MWEDMIPEKFYNIINESFSQIVACILWTMYERSQGTCFTNRIKSSLQASKKSPTRPVISWDSLFIVKRLWSIYTYNIDIFIYKDK